MSVHRDDFQLVPFRDAVGAKLDVCPGRLGIPALVYRLIQDSRFQVPATPMTLAWPPSRPSVPTSRATRVTSPAKRLS